ncbi:phage tail length tape measure family protein [bacterium BS0013]
MPTIETIRRIRIEQESKGGAAVRADLEATASAQTKLGAAAEAAATVTETASRRTLSAAGAFDRLRASVDASFRSQQAMERATNLANRAFEQGATDAATYERTLAQIQARYSGVEQAAARAAQAQRQAWRDLSAEGSKVLDNIEASRKLGSIGMAPPANSNGGHGHGQISDAYRSQLLQDIAFQAKDFGEQVLAGSSPIRAALQQGPQALAIAQMGGLGPKDIAAGFGEKLGSIAEGASNVAARLGLVGGAVGAVTAAVGTGAAALAAYREQQKDLSLSLSGMGRASGATLGQINSIAAASAGPAGLSVSAARDMEGQFAATGRIGSEMYGKLLGAARDYAYTTRQELPEAAKALAEAFADPVAGAELLNKQLGLLDAETEESIQHLSAQGNRLGAQRVLFDALAGSVEKADARLGFFSRQWQQFSRNTSNEFDAIGRAIDRFTTGGDLETRIADLQKVLATKPGFLESFSSTRPALQGELDKLLAEQQRQQAQSRTADLAQRSLALNKIVQGANPEGEALKKAQDAATRIRTDLAAGVIDPTGESRRTMEGFEASARRIAEDLKAGGSAMAESLRRAQFDASQVGRSGIGRTTAEIENEFAERSRKLEASNLEPSKRFEQMQTMELERVTKLQTAQREAMIAETGRSGLINTVPTNLRQFYLDAAAQTGVPLDFGIAVSKAESSFNTTARPNDPRSHAYGLMQLQPGTAREVGVDPSDPAQNVLGGFRYLRQQLDRANNDQALAYGYYHDGPNSDGNSAAARKAYAGIARTMNQPTEGQNIAGTDTRARALENENRLVGINSEFLGRNGQALDAATRQQQLLNEAIAAGRDVTPQLRKEFADTAAAMAAATRNLAGTKAGRDLDFGREQLGRDAGEQRLYSQARGIFGDTSTPASKAFIDQSRDLQDLQEAKTMVTDGATSFVQALRRGASASDALASAFGSAADKLLSKAMDSAISAAFGSATGGGGGLGGLASMFGSSGGGAAGSMPDLGSIGSWLTSSASFIGFSGGGYTGHGGKYEPAGIVHRGEYVMDAATVGRLGRGYLDGLRGYANGGYVDLPDSPAPMPPAANASAAGGISAPVTINMQGSSGDPAADRAAADMAGKAVAKHMEAVAMGVLQRESRPGGSMYRGGVRRQG